MRACLLADHRGSVSVPLCSVSFLCPVSAGVASSAKWHGRSPGMMILTMVLQISAGVASSDKRCSMISPWFSAP